jgi:hypothetical protein
MAVSQTRPPTPAMPKSVTALERHSHARPRIEISAPPTAIFTSLPAACQAAPSDAPSDYPSSATAASNLDTSESSL